MNYLIITAHPSSKGFTHRIAKAFAEEVEKKGHHAEIFDLYKEEYHLPFLRFEDPHDVSDLPVRDMFQQKITEAQEVVFIHPIWWGAPPAILKNWLDHVFASKFAFRYTPKGPVGLLKGKQARLFCTGGSPWWLYMCICFPFFIIWRLFVLWFCGFSIKNTTYFHNSPKTTEEQKMSYLEKVKAYARQG